MAYCLVGTVEACLRKCRLGRSFCLHVPKTLVEIDRVDRSNRSSELEDESVDKFDSKSTFGSGADSAEHGEQ